MEALLKHKAVIISLVAIAAVILLGSAFTSNKTMEDTTTTDENKMITFRTSMGDITIEMYEDKMPITTGNFIKLAEDGYYTGTKFHRVIENFMVQGGDPNTKGSDTSIYGQGGPGYTIEDEFVEGLSNVRGTISMANTGQVNSGGSQFFINLVDNTNLDFNQIPESSKHPVFGRVTDGMDIVDLIAKVEKTPAGLPIEPIIINEVLIK